MSTPTKKTSPRPKGAIYTGPLPQAAQLVVPAEPKMDPVAQTLVAMALPPPDSSDAPAGLQALRDVFEAAKPKQAYTAESQKWGHLVAPYMKGNGIELATGGAPIVPTSIQFELSPASYARYNSGQPLRGPVQWRSDNAIFNLPFKDEVLDYVASSHLIEDFLPDQQFILLKEWVRVLKRGGKLIVCAPDKKLWDWAVANGQPCNCAHRHEIRVGELSMLAPRLGLAVICDKLTNTPPNDYNVFFAAQRV